MELKKIIGINLKYYRYQKGESQDKFYSSLNLPIKYLASVERGKENISLEYIEDIAKKLNISTEELISFNPEHIIKKKRIDEKIKVKK